MKKHFLFTLALCASMMAQGTEFWKESFDYQEGELTTLTSVEEMDYTHWFISSSTGSSVIQVVDTNLTYPNYCEKASGKAIRTTTYSKTYSRQFEPVTSGSLLYSALIRVNKPETLTLYPYSILSFSDNTSKYAVLYLDKFTDGYKLGVTKGNEEDGRGTRYSDTLTYGQTYLVVVRYNFIEGEKNDEVSLYINPSVETGLPTLTCAQDTLVYFYKQSGAVTKEDATSLSSLCILDGGRSTHDIFIDEVYVTTRLADLWIKAENLPAPVTYGNHIKVTPEFISGIEVGLGTELTFTADVRTGFAFKGFYKDSNFETPITEGVIENTCTTTVTDTFSIYAKYEQVSLEEPISYLYPVYNTENDPISGIKEWKTGMCETYTVITNDSSAAEQVQWNTGWYVIADDNVQFAKGIMCIGAVHIILTDGAKMTVNANIGSSSVTHAGLHVTGGDSSLVIYGQALQSGQLIAHAKKTAAAIGGGNKLPGADITINGGIIIADSEDNGAAIGGGSRKNGTNITINGGKIKALAWYNDKGHGAGIGGGYSGDGNNIIINGGDITASGSAGAAIGGGRSKNGTNITINGGDIKAGCATNACIGGGTRGTCTNLAIRGGKIDVISAMADAAIGAGNNSPTPATNITVDTTLIIKHARSSNRDTVIASDRTNTTDITKELLGKYHVIITLPSFVVTYGDNITVNPTFVSGTEVIKGTQLVFTAAQREGYEFVGFFSDETLDTPITEGVEGNVYTTIITYADVAVYAKYEVFSPTSISQRRTTKRNTMKVLTNGQVILRIGEKNYNILGAEVK